MEKIESNNSLAPLSTKKTLAFAFTYWFAPIFAIVFFMYLDITLEDMVDMSEIEEVVYETVTLSYLILLSSLIGYLYFLWYKLSKIFDIEKLRLFTTKFFVTRLWTVLHFVMFCYCIAFFYFLFIL